MPFDIYRNWPLPERCGNIFPVFTGINLEEQVLKDLAATKDPTDKLEILDSYAAYSQRVYRARIAEALSLLAGHILSTLLQPQILTYLPDAGPPHRGRPAKEGKEGG